MNFRLLVAVLAMLLFLLVVGWVLTLRRWQEKGFVGSNLRYRQHRVRKFSAKVVFVLWALAAIFWRWSAVGITGSCPDVHLLPLGGIVCLIGFLAVRGFWFVTRFRWLQSVSYRASLQAGIVAVVSAISAYDLRNLPGQTLGYLLILTFLSAMVALSAFILELQLPDTEDMLVERIGDLQESQATIDEKTDRAVDALKNAAELVDELEKSIRQRSEDVRALRKETEESSKLAKIEGEKAEVVLQKITQTLNQDKHFERLINVLLTFGSGLLFLVLALLWNPYIKRWLGIQ